MPDRENVISELNEYIESALAICAPDVDYIPVDLLQYTVELLKEQEAVSPLFVSGDGQFFCGACKFPLGVSGVNFCSGCGRRVKWT